MVRIGIDVGGTFTDLVAVDDEGRTTLAKTPSTPDDPAAGVLEGLAILAQSLGLPRAALLRSAERIVHGTTVATNALLERKGAKLALLTTEGHRDVLEMREGLKEDRYNLRLPPPEPLVPRRLRLPVRERMRADGRVETALEAGSLEGAIRVLRSEGVEAAAVCYLHSWRDGGHERATREALRRALPRLHVSLSCEVLQQIKEFERVSTTVVNAYVGPSLSRYLERLEARLAAEGYAGPILVMQSHGGVAPIKEAANLAAGAVLSGPAGGVAGSLYAARLLGALNLIPFDMGGTSTDISLVQGGAPTLVAGRGVGGERLALQSLDIASIGAGGGSIARVDAGGILHVGPESAGAEPGPACYARGGEEATVTDANLVLGLLDETRFLGGRRPLDKEAALAAVERVGRALDIGVFEAAAGIHRVVNTHMAEGVRLLTVRRGVDPRGFALFAFGGASGLHATAIAGELGIRRVVVPRVAAVLSAWGMLATDLRFEAVRTHLGDVRALDGGAVKSLFAALEREARARLSATFDGPCAVSRSADMRYGEQVFEVAVALDGVDWSADDPLPQIVERFHRRHRELFTYALAQEESVLVNARVAVRGLLTELPQEPPLPERPPACPRKETQVWLGRSVAASVYDFDAIAAGQRIAGPALVESDMTTVLLRPGERALVTAQGWLDIALAEGRAAVEEKAPPPGAETS